MMREDWKEKVYEPDKEEGDGDIREVVVILHLQ